jgi:hypothetical protein
VRSQAGWEGQIARERTCDKLLRATASDVPDADSAKHHQVMFFWVTMVKPFLVKLVKNDCVVLASPEGIAQLHGLHTHTAYSHSQVAVEMCG